MTSALTLGPGFTIDANLATRRAVLLGQPDVGKTNGLTVIAEGLLKLGVPVAVLDWKGDLWGLRSSADGLKAGYPVVIFGGDHADVDVTEGDGREIGYVVAREHMPAIIDLSAFESDAARRRFYTAFLKAFLQAKAPEQFRTPHPLLIDEFDQFAPERPYGDAVGLLGAVQSVFGLGRKRGIGVLGTSLRAAQLAKSVVELSDVYLFMQAAGRNDLKAIEDTVRRYASAEQLAEMRASIPRLGKGEVLVYSPAWLGVLEKHRFALRSTFDSSRTPEVGVKALAGPKAFAAVDAPALAARIAATRDKREADDPDALRKRIAELEKTAVAPVISTPLEIEVERIIEKPILTDADRAHLDKISDQLKALQEQHVYLVDRMGGRLDDVAASFDAIVKRIAAALVAVPSVPVVRQNVAPVQQKPASVQQTSPSVQPEGISKGATGLLEVLVARHPMKVTTQQWATMSGRSIRSSSFRPHITELLRADLVEIVDGMYVATKAGVKSLGGNVARPATAVEIITMWTSRLPAGPARMLNALVAVYPDALPRNEIAEASGMSPTSSGVGAALTVLKNNRLIEISGNVVRAATELFP